MADLTTTQSMAEGLSHHGLVYLCALSWSASLGLFLWLMRVTRLRVDDRDDFQRKLEALTERLAVHMDRNTEATTLLLADAQARARRRRSGEVPALGAEPTTGAKRAGGGG